MRSAIGPVLVIFGLATTLLLVIVMFQVGAARDDAARIGEQVRALESEVAAIEPGVQRTELQRQLDDLESGIRNWLGTTGGGAGGGNVSSTTDPEVREGIEEILDRIQALEDRLDEICEGVPVC